jgi:pyrimidine operon attenuation protein/uracil phosphoribosyltransferase
MRQKAEIMDEAAMMRAIARISFEIIERNRGIQNLCIIGIRRGGAPIAKKIADKIGEIEGVKIDLGFLDITPYRDDLANRQKIDNGGTQIDFDVNDHKVILVDDVMFTGRSTRAAIDAIMDRGRPQLIQLAVLIDRGHRELPIRPDFVGKNVPTSTDEIVRVLFTEFDGVNRAIICEEEGELI